MIRITETELIDQKPSWLRLERGRLFVNHEEIKPKSNQLQIVFAENDGKPHLIVADEKMAKTLPKLKGAAFPKRSELSTTTEQICRDFDQFWSTLKSTVEHRTQDGKANK